ncbi:Short chain dehydrogenase reductase family [Colletotrichum higginsianum IMI 349063]|uniref:Short chain dehydrogenase reductase family n=2 Tax=Colletotrichum higginsianum TaxID=80884 RepID=A0A1B7YF09_COLHI|nr:Short chain dehydrogenase reductase family [Colletotrichum higginsianum IMI 349063]OBR10510.1 Short chain dehydrogenase reductase family [Colletotrichum higginsianum IMI 349063]TID06381.1 putative oxidoreductase YkvO [Colletotrichum higginsianum]GJD04790.1 short chain dehydrogenase reductase family [Colletotrichum higginsianum]
MAPHTYKYLNKLAQKRVLVIGGSSGLGYAAAEASIEHGAAVILASSSPAKLASAAARLRDSHPASQVPSSPIPAPAIATFAIDLADLDNLTANLTTLLDAATDGGASKLDHIIYTADAASPLPPLSETAPRHITSALSLRAHAPLLLASVLEAAPGKYIFSSPDASVTFTNGSSSHRPMPGWAVADAAAAATEGLVRGLACALAPLRVNLVSSGPVTTELLRSLPEETAELFRAKCLTGRLGRPEDVAEAYLYLMKDGFISGSTIFTEGGRILSS